MQWNEDLEIKVAGLYKTFGTPGIEHIAKEMGTTPKSVISKLVKMQMYTPISKKAPEEKTTKKIIVSKLTKLTGRELRGIEAAPKDTLCILLELLENKPNTQLELPI